MSTGIDADLILLDEGLYDFQLDADGDIKSEDAFDTAIIVSLFAERRASESEIRQPELRRGWIGNQGEDFEIGSKIWLYEQARTNRTSLNGIVGAATDALQWLVEGGLATAVRDVDSILTRDGVQLVVKIDRPDGTAETRVFNLWENTGLPSGG